MRIRSSSILVFLFLNSSGAWTSWLMLGPFLTQSSNTLVAFGLFALIRQLFGFVGTTVAESLNFGKDIGKINIWIEIVLVIVNAIAIFAISSFAPEKIVWVIYAWSFVRYFIGGFSTVSVYKLLISKANPGKSVVAQLALSQGAVLFGATIAYLLSRYVLAYGIQIALILDVLTSLCLIFFLKSVNIVESYTRPESLLKRFLGIFVGLPMAIGWRKAIGFICGLASLGGLPTLFMFFSQSDINISKIYSLFNVANGAFLIIFAYLILRYESVTELRRWMLLFGTFAIAIASMILISVKAEEAFPYIILLSSGSTALLLPLHHLTIEKVSTDHSAQVRASMAICLTLIFGTSEILSAIALASGFLDYLMLFRICMVAVCGWTLGIRK